MILKSRLLTDRETQSLRRLYHDSVDFNRVTMRRGGPLTWTRAVVTINNQVYWPRDLYCDDFTAPGRPLWLEAVLFHELCHVWQYQNRQHPRLKAYTWRSALKEHLRFDDPYQYNPYEHPRLTDYRFEQQGRIIQDYVHSDFTNLELKSLIKCDIPDILD